MEKPKPNLPALSPKRPLDTVDPVRKYVQEINQYPFLTPQEERTLAIQYRETGDREAVKKLITSHLRLVVKIAKEYRSAYGNLLDLVQEGNVGLLQATKRFDPDKGTRLASYASWWIRSYILKYILDNFRLIKIGTTQAQRRIFFNLMKEKEKIEKMGIKPDAKNLALAMDVTPEEVTEMEGRLSRSDLSLDRGVGEDESHRPIDDLKSEAPLVDETMAKTAFQDILEDKLAGFGKTLNEREGKIFRERLLAEVPMTLQTIADEYGISRERARQIEERIKEKLKKHFEEEGFQIQEHWLS